MLSRRGFTLVELLVATALAAIVLGAATASLLRQQRTHARVVSVTDGDAQTRAALLVLGSQLALLDPLAGDLTQGEAEDSAMQFRAVVATSVACRTETGAVTLIPTDTDTIPLGGGISDPRPGDTLWWLGDSVWSAARIGAAGPAAAVCAGPVPAAGPSLRLVLGASDTIPAGTPVRVTRQARFGIYRATDGTWQLGYREWNDPTHRFAAPQPVAGPLVPRAAPRRSDFRYFDSAGVELLPVPGAIDVQRISRIRVTARTWVRTLDASQDSVRADSVDIPLHHGDPQ